MADSILVSVKKNLGLASDYTAFDEDVIMHINSILAVLNQIGIGPDSGFAIEDDTAVWSDFIGDNLLLNQVKTYMYLRVRILFDPPSTSYHINAANEQIREFESRMNMVRESTAWTDPTVDALDESVYVIDGGTP